MYRFLYTTLQRVALIAFLALVYVAGSAPAHAQAWRQTVEIIVPVKEDGIIETLLDSLLTRMEADDIQVRRDRESEETFTLAQLESSLQNEGLFLNSANRVFIIYKMEGDQRGFRSSIEELFFIFRPDGEYADVDIPMMLIDGQQTFVKEVLMNSGTNLPTNEAAFKPFNDQMMMHQLATTSEAVIVKVGEKVIREQRESEQERIRLLTTIRQFLNL